MSAEPSLSVEKNFRVQSSLATPVVKQSLAQQIGSTRSVEAGDERSTILLMMKIPKLGF